jgi:hypothetical protein
MFVLSCKIRGEHLYETRCTHYINHKTENKRDKEIDDDR